MKVLFYGYGKHAKRIKKCIDENLKIPVNYCYLTSDIQKVDNKNYFISLKKALNKFKEFSCAFISSPNIFHLTHLKDCINNKIPYIYVEKPAIGVEEYLRGNNQVNDSIKYIQVGYQYVYNPAICKLKNIVDNKSSGSLLRLDIFFGKGLAFKKEFEKEWRSKDPKEIAYTLGSHLINIAIHLLGKSEILNINSKVIKSSENNFYDTYHVYGITKNSALFSLTASWGSPLNQSIKGYFSDMIWHYDMKSVSKQYPRDCFDENGFFKEPPIFQEVCNHNGINYSVCKFLAKVISKKRYNFELNNAAFINKFISEN